MRTPKSSIILILLASITGALAQFLFKKGSESTISTIVGKVLSQDLYTTATTLFSDNILKNGFFTFVGFSFYGFGALLLVLALRKGELSIIYPLFAANYVWVALISVFYFGEEIKSIEWLGIALIVCGVSLVGYGGSSTNNNNNNNLSSSKQNSTESSL